MNPIDVLGLVGKAGGSVSLSANGNLRVAAPRPLPDEVLESLRQNKTSVVQRLRRRAEAATKAAPTQADAASSEGIGEGVRDLDDYLADFYERAAVGEYEGGLPREQAERQALRETLRSYKRFGLRDEGRQFLPQSH